MSVKKPYEGNLYRYYLLSEIIRILAESYEQKELIGYTNASGFYLREKRSRNFLTGTSFSNTVEHFEIWYPGFIENLLTLLERQSELVGLKSANTEELFFDPQKCFTCGNKPHLRDCHIGARKEIKKGTQVKRMLISAYALVHPALSMGHAYKRDKKKDPPCKWYPGEVRNHKKYHEDYCPHLLSVMYRAGYNFAKNSKLKSVPFLEKDGAFGLGFYSYINSKS